MKIQCDMCEKNEASVYCTADEASLCHGCDRRVHHANKLASKHHRFSLHPSSDQPPLCDICQEKRAFLFCKEDRAILCKSCDISIHGANKHTQYHNRFLLTGVKLSKSSSCYDSSSDQSHCSSNSNGSSNSRKHTNGSKNQNPRKPTYSTSVNDRCEGVSQDKGVSMEASSISEYLTETLPGWHIEEFLNPPASHPYGLFEGPFMAHDSDSNGDLGSFWSEALGNLVNSSDDQISKTSGLSQRYLVNEMENFDNLYKDQYTFERPRQLW